MLKALHFSSQTQRTAFSLYPLSFFLYSPFIENVTLIPSMYVIKQNIRFYIYIAYSRPNGCTNWAEIFLWALRGGRGLLSAKKIRTIFSLIFFSAGNAGPYSLSYIKNYPFKSILLFKRGQCSNICG